MTPIGAVLAFYPQLVDRRSIGLLLTAADNPDISPSSRRLPSQFRPCLYNNTNITSPHTHPHNRPFNTHNGSPPAAHPAHQARHDLANLQIRLHARILAVAGQAREGSCDRRAACNTRCHILEGAHGHGLHEHGRSLDYRRSWGLSQQVIRMFHFPVPRPGPYTVVPLIQTLECALTTRSTG